MGQVVLGFRSLAVKLAVFVALATVLAWILGGTLWPRPVVRLLGEPVGAYQVVVISTDAPKATFGVALVDVHGKVTAIAPREGETAWDAATMLPAGDRGGWVMYIADGQEAVFNPATGERIVFSEQTVSFGEWLAQPAN